MIKQREVDAVFAALCLWKEARGEPLAAKVAQVWVQRNRVEAHWIHDECYQDVASHPYQFSGMTAPGDPNLAKLPESSDLAWRACLAVVEMVMVATPEQDSTQGAVFYHDISIPGAPAAWGPVVRTNQLGRLVFYKPQKHIAEATT